MEWKDEYSIGIQEIDDQHKLLLRSFTAIEESIRSDQGWSNTHYAILELNQLASMHFTFEEALMKMFGYPETEAHKREHQRFFAEMGRIERHSLNKSAEVEMVQFLRSWLTTHILGSDRSYARHIFSGAQVVRSSPAPATVSGPRILSDIL
ncbi:bacteriohemerythrin [mine drainage metagenome]|uniref:Bacteriohemerythrin n=1 Tax=mine drainage metagenome TaxID=410659 RepID=A0A1J5TGH9_9ZZZZ